MGNVEHAILAFFLVLSIFLVVGMLAGWISDPGTFVKEEYTNIAFTVAVWVFVVVVNGKYGWSKTKPKTRIFNKRHSAKLSG